MTRSVSIVLPYFNEEDFLPTVLECALAQEHPPHQLIVVDNGSTDRSAEVCARILRRAPMDVVHVSEEVPGKIAALNAGCAQATGDVIAFWDADTWYPPQYVRACAEVFERAPEDTVAVFAVPHRRDPRGWWGRWVEWSYLIRAALWPRQVLTGGYGHAVRADALRDVGGFTDTTWPYVLLDHEIMHRLFKLGRGWYDAALWCRPSTRREDRRSVRWNLGERVLYHLTPYRWKDWYFYGFLGPRLRRRGLSHLNLRRQPWRAPAPSRPGAEPESTPGARS